MLRLDGRPGTVETGMRSGPVLCAGHRGYIHGANPIVRLLQVISQSVNDRQTTVQ